MWTEVLDATYMDDYRILIRFNDGARKIIDFSDLINKYPVFKPLHNLYLFKNFQVTDTLEWDNGRIDIAPEYLYENGIPA